MDQDRFDALARALASGRSRRGLLKAIAGGALGAMAAAVGFGETEARALRSVGDSCNADHDCASNLCVQETRTRKICHCRSAVDCPAARDLCHSAACLPAGDCGLSINVGASCDDHNLCTQTDVCDHNGACVGGNPVVCQPLDQCHVAGVCNPANGACSSPAKADGSPCGSGQACCGGVCCPNAVDVCHNGCCTPDAKPTTCAGKCGTVSDNCGQAVDCGGCDTAQCLTCGAGNVCVSTCGSGQACCGGDCKQAAGSSCAGDADCCSGVCVEETCQAGCSAAGGRCDDATDCCAGTNCVGISNGVGLCCAGNVACGPTCCQPDTACTTASCADELTCRYVTRPDCCVQDSDCPTPRDHCQQAVCDTTTNTCGTAPVPCPSGQACCGGTCIDVSSDPNNCGGCGAVCTANTPCTGPIISVGCCQTGSCSGGFCNGSIPICGSCATPACDPTEGATCVSNCPPLSPSDLCHAGTGTCQLDGSCAYPSTCAACETCDPATGACTSACASCETCDHGSGQCVSTCGSCQVCDQSSGTCRECASCETCDAASGQCVSTCNSPGFYCAVTPGMCVWNPYISNWSCEYDSKTCPSCYKCDDTTNNQCLPDAGHGCGTCRVCDQAGNCVPSPAGTNCGSCQVCSGSGSCQIAPQGTSCGTCQVCDFGGACVPAAAGTHDSGCAANQVCNGSGACGCAFMCGGTCCPAGTVDCCDLGARPVCCPEQCQAAVQTGTTYCPSGG